MASTNHHREAPPLVGPPNGPGTFPRVKKNHCESPSKFSTSSSFTNSTSPSSPCSSGTSSSSTSSSPCSTLTRVSAMKRSMSQTSVTSDKSKVVATGLKKCRFLFRILFGFTYPHFVSFRLMKLSCL